MVQKYGPSWPLTRRRWRLSTWGVSERYLMYAVGLMSPMQRCFCDLVCQPFVTSYVIDAYLFGHVVGLGPGVPSHDPLRLMVDTYECRKPMPSWRRPPGRPRNVWLSKVQRCANDLLMLWTSQIARVRGAAQWSTRTTRWWWWSVEQSSCWTLWSQHFPLTISSSVKYAFVFERSHAPSHFSF